jgi:6-phosphogluconolactonase
MKLEVKIFRTPEEIAFQISEEIANLVSYNAKKRRDTYISFSGGSTPKILFKTLSNDFKDKIDWKKLHLFWGDERCVPPDDYQSNYGMTKKYLLDNIEIPEINVHRIRGEDDPQKEVSRISAEIKRIVPQKHNLPQFDLNLLGVGEDGHTASLFPRKKLKNISDRISGIAVHPGSEQKRISLTFDVINNSSQNIFMVTGAKKSDIIFEIMSKNDSFKRFPAARVKADEILKWYLDQEAAGKIKMP